MSGIIDQREREKWEINIKHSKITIIIKYVVREVGQTLKKFLIQKLRRTSGPTGLRSWRLI